MKTITTISKTILRASLVLILIFTASCSKDDDNSNDTEAFVALPANSLTTYTGDLNYSGTAGTIVVLDSATATITGQGTTYTINFSDGAPSINNVRFSLVNGTYITAGTSNIVITIADEALSIQAQQNGNNWVFDGDR